MTLKLGDKSFSNIYVGDKKIAKAYVGDRLVFSGVEKIDPATTYNQFRFDTNKVTGKTVTLQDFRAGDTTEWDGVTDWGDGKTSTELTHTYLTDGSYTVKTKYTLCNADTGSYDSDTVKMLTGCPQINRNITTLRKFFYECTNLLGVNTDIDTRNITDMSYAFYDCINLTDLDVSNWNTGKVTSLYNTFWYCAALKSIDVSNWDISNVTTMYRTFYSCSTLKKVTMLGTAPLTSTTSGMFTGCTNLQTIIIPSLSTSKNANISNMFNGCNKLTYLDIHKWELSSSASYGNQAFQGCSSLLFSNIDMEECNNTTKNIITTAYNSSMS